MSTVLQTPATATALDSEIMATWLELYRKTIVAEGCVVRAGARDTIEVQIMNRVGHVFQPISGPDGKQSFGPDRDLIVRRLQGYPAEGPSVS